jgi:hypothetical protein
VVGRASSLDHGRRKVAGYQLDSCKPTHYSILVHMALAKTTLSLISKTQKEILHVLLSCDEREDTPCFANIRKWKSWPKLKS